jgi:predicted transcriptional regulator
VARKPSQRAPGEGAGARSDLRQGMGDLEAEIMECVWDLGTASVREVHHCLAERREIAYTTVMTVMSRLAGKGLLTSRPEGRAYVYQASCSRDEYCAGQVRSFMSQMLGEADRAVLASFVDSVSEHDRAQLDLLAEMIEQKRREERSSE